ncbi:hypothetical protein GOP47_0017585 [Adiantum capillus-veneris]|uniref:RNB domain-containing protein n=1 Tax=Adiantum capillus-veneris TaxID=13818 RepID=A0A9D4ZAQ6_ADICA|nr:hypothetical protein GOP47_0017585 [Adiantum capillus-veneris]
MAASTAFTRVPACSSSVCEARHGQHASRKSAHFNLTLRPLGPGEKGISGGAVALIRPFLQVALVTCVTNVHKATLQKGVLIEFKKDSGRIVLGVTQNREGKRNWTVVDQDADTFIVKPNQVKFVIPGTDNFNPQDVSRLLQEAERLQDPALLEIAWEEMLLDEKTADIEELASILYGSAAPEKCYGAYKLVASNPIYFKCKEEGYSPKYEPRTIAQVKELQAQQMREEMAHKKLLDFVDFVKSVMQLPFEERPTRNVWDAKDAFQAYLESLKLFALDMCESSDIRSLALQLLDQLKMNKTPTTALNLLTQIRYFKLHENFSLLKQDIQINFSAEALAEAEAIIDKPLYDVDREIRVDLTTLKVYTIDCYDPDEIDDGLSAIRLPDGRLKVWIHIADPTRWIDWKSALQKEASQRGASIYLPTLTLPMLPKTLGVDLLSLREREYCSAVSVSITLSQNGSIAEQKVENSVISPTYALSYEAASELLGFGLKEEEGLSFLHEAALLRKMWRQSNGALDAFLPSIKVSVKDDDAKAPDITVCVEDQNCPSILLVTEMMLLCGEVIAAFGNEHRLCLPYKGQAYNEICKTELVSIPDGPAQATTSIRYMKPVELNFMQPLQHSCLGLPGYVQFTSPLRRYSDFMVHYQVKATLRNDIPPISSGYMEASMAAFNSRVRILKKLQSECERYWILEYLRREPSERRYRVCLLRSEKNSTALVFLLEVGLQNLMDLSTQRQLGDEFFVRVVDSQPRKGWLYLKEA